MNINLYRTFAAVYECRNMSMAAHNLNVSQPTVSYTIKELEKQIGKTLFRQARRGVTVTPCGYKLYPVIKEALGKLTRADETIDVDIIKKHCKRLKSYKK